MILLSSLLQSYDHIVTIILYDKKTLILEEVTLTLLSNEIRKRSNQEERQDQIWWSQEEKEEEKRKVRARQRHATFVTGKVIGRMTTSKEVASCGGRRGKLCRGH